jgi:hypothetical protein
MKGNEMELTNEQALRSHALSYALCGRSSSLASEVIEAAEEYLEFLRRAPSPLCESPAAPPSREEPTATG